jgi:hypothetical protein
MNTESAYTLYSQPPVDDDGDDVSAHGGERRLIAIRARSSVAMYA